MSKLNKFNKKLEGADCGLFFSAIHNIQAYLLDTNNQQKQEKYLLGVLKTKSNS